VLGQPAAATGRVMPMIRRSGRRQGGPRRGPRHPLGRCVVLNSASPLDDRQIFCRASPRST
jgi:hypothetical protein